MHWVRYGILLTLYYILYFYHTSAISFAAMSRFYSIFSLYFVTLLLLALSYLLTLCFEQLREQILSGPLCINQLLCQVTVLARQALH